MRTLQQKRAAHALNRVRELADKLNSDHKKDYRAYVDRLGPAIVMNGLGQALASELAAKEAKEKKPHYELYLSLKSWLCSPSGVYQEDNDLLDAVTKHGETEYLRAQAEALAWLEWHKKFCRAQFPTSEND